MDTREEWLRELNPTKLQIELEEAEKRECEYCGDLMTDHPQAVNNKCFKDVDNIIYLCPDCVGVHMAYMDEPLNIKIHFDANKP